MATFGFRKRAKTELLSKDELKSFSKDFPEIVSDLKTAFNILTVGYDETTSIGGGQNVLIPLRITDASPQTNSSFSHCYCHVKQYMEGVRFNAVFNKGFNILFSFLKENKIPEGEIEQLALRKLMTFFARNLDAVVESDAVVYKDESDVCLFLMNHLIGKLSACDEWKMDIGTRRKRSLICPCSVPDCPLKQPADDDFQDLSIGNTDVWHGMVDAMTFYDKLPIVVLERGSGDDETLLYQSGCALEFKENAFTGGEQDQFYGETIVYSFLHKMFDDAITFVPVLGVKMDAIKVAMYDTETDLLLTSPEIRFKGAEVSQLSVVAYLIIWLTCNFKTFYTQKKELSLVKTKSCPADFKKFAKEKLVIYEKHLRFKKVRRKQNKQRLKVPEASHIEGTHKYTF